MILTTSQLPRKFNIHTSFGSLGDSLGLTAILRELYRLDYRVSVTGSLPDVFINNPFIIPYQSDFVTYDIQPVTNHKTNPISYYCSQLGITIHDYRPDLFLSTQETEEAAKCLKSIDDKRTIAIVTKSGWESHNMRLDLWQLIIDRFREADFNVIELGKFTYGALKTDLNLVGKISLRETFAVLSFCNLYFGIDTGLFHAAAALSIPQVVLYMNDGASINRYETTHYIDSNVKCDPRCYTGCLSKLRCHDNFDLDLLFKLSINVINKYEKISRSSHMC